MSSVPRPSAMVASIGVAAAFFFASSASAATFTVNDSGDAGDADTAVAACATVGNVCTLRAAMEQAAAGLNPGLDTIQFSLPDPTVINVPTNLPNFSQDLTIIGPGAGKLSLVGTPSFSVLVMDNGTVSISGLTITGGQAQQGGGIYKTGGDLTLDGVVVSGNKATFINAASASASGAGIQDFAGSMTIKRSTVSGNISTANATASGNAVVKGSGIYSSTTLTVEQSFISNNSSQATAGGTANAAATGGGIYHTGFDTFVLKNSTVSDNSINASGGAFPLSQGGGVYTTSSGFTATSDTITLNGATINTNPAGAIGGNLHRENGPATIRNTIISSPFSAPNCGGVALTDGGFNLVSSNDCPGLEAAIHANPMLDISGGAENGGPTKTFKLLPGSPAIDGGKNFLPEGIDQRGSGRPSEVTAIANAVGGDGSDIGAYEASTSALTVTTSGTGTGNVSGTGIDCGGAGHTDCAESYLDGTPVTLAATPASSSGFSGWSGGGCSGTAGCSLAMNTPSAVDAAFALLPLAPPAITGSPTASSGPTGARAAALKRCRKKRGAARKRCKKRANKLPA